jgi:translation elongation factor EF-Ts
VEDLLREVISTTGENVAIRRFVRWEVGEALE